jgi:hypothetical protein
MGDTTHTQCRLLSPFDGLVAADVGITHVLYELWAAGVRTYYSCQGDDTRLAYVAVNHHDRDNADRVLWDVLQTRPLWDDDMYPEEVELWNDIVAARWVPKEPGFWLSSKPT